MHKLVLLRHGESTWNQENRFTGWTDVDLSERGLAEGKEAGLLLRRAGSSSIRVHVDAPARHQDARDHARRARAVVDPRRQELAPQRASHGAPQGLNKAETAAQHGEAQIKIWRRSYDIPPPALEPGDARHPSRDSRYAGMSPDELPSTESLKDTVARFLPYWHETIAPSIDAGKRVIIAAHGNTLRALVKSLDEVPEAEIVELNIPTGIPLVYELLDASR